MSLAASNTSKRHTFAKTAMMSGMLQLVTRKKDFVTPLVTLNIIIIIIIYVLFFLFVTNVTEKEIHKGLCSSVNFFFYLYIYPPPVTFVTPPRKRLFRQLLQYVTVLQSGRNIGVTL